MIGPNATPSTYTPLTATLAEPSRLSTAARPKISGRLRPKTKPQMITPSEYIISPVLSSIIILATKLTMTAVAIAIARLVSLVKAGAKAAPPIPARVANAYMFKNREEPWSLKRSIAISSAIPIIPSSVIDHAPKVIARNQANAPIGALLVDEKVDGASCSIDDAGGFGNHLTVNNTITPGIASTNNTAVMDPPMRGTVKNARATISRLKIIAMFAERSGLSVFEVAAEAAPSTNPEPIPAINSKTVNIVALGITMPMIATMIKMIVPKPATGVRLWRRTHGRITSTVAEFSSVMAVAKVPVKPTLMSKSWTSRAIIVGIRFAGKNAKPQVRTTALNGCLPLALVLVAVIPYSR